MGGYVTGLKESEKNVTVIFNKSPGRTFDVLVAAGGLHSKIRGLPWSNDEVEVRSLEKFILRSACSTADLAKVYWKRRRVNGTERVCFEAFLKTPFEWLLHPLLRPFPAFMVLVVLRWCVFNPPKTALVHRDMDGPTA
jgi:2-polyprenyl-6-methoxyphenol hydroxylase-like FAD-dependent oxidoreductase